VGKQEITRATFLEELTQAVPDVTPLVAEHLADHDELLAHLLMPDLLRFATAAFAEGRHEVSARLMCFIDECLLRGDDYIENAVAVSFVEHFGAWPGETSVFLETWPDGLRAELRRQQE
jgi:hypothetical protein